MVIIIIGSRRVWLVSVGVCSGLWLWLLAGVGRFFSPMSTIPICFLRHWTVSYSPYHVIKNRTQLTMYGIPRLGRFFVAMDVANASERDLALVSNTCMSRRRAKVQFRELDRHSILFCDSTLERFEQSCIGFLYS